METSGFDIFWDPTLMEQDLLPATFFDANFPVLDIQPSIQPPRMISFSRFSSRLPAVEYIEHGPEDDDQAEGNPTSSAEPWFISEPGYERISAVVQQYAEVLPAGCSLPSRNSLTVYLEKYLRCVQEFLPFIHTATFLAEQKDVELLLALAAIGAQYKFEHLKSYELYFLVKAILLEKARREEVQSASDLLSGRRHPTTPYKNDLGKIQTLILLISFASWADKRIVSDALSMGSKLAALVRKNGISEPDEMLRSIDWLSWIAIEEKRRTLLAAYVVSNLHCIALDIPPLLMNHEVGVCLPGYAEQWRSKDATHWRQVPRQVERRFIESLRSLFDAVGIPKDASVSSFSNYLLIHGLQDIYIDRRGSTPSLHPVTIRSFETTLRTWQLSWELTEASTLDPESPQGTTRAQRYCPISTFLYSFGLGHRSVWSSTLKRLTTHNLEERSPK